MWTCPCYVYVVITVADCMLSRLCHTPSCTDMSAWDLSSKHNSVYVEFLGRCLERCNPGESVHKLLSRVSQDLQKDSRVDGGTRIYQRPEITNQLGRSLSLADPIVDLSGSGKGQALVKGIVQVLNGENCSASWLSS